MDKRPFEARLKDRIEDARADDGCWNWTGGRFTDGYGRINRGSRSVRAHRAVYEALVGEIPDDFTIDHLCENPLCVNPAHMEPVTAAENVRRRHARQTHCAHGHAFTDENTYVYVWSNGRTYRKCRACARDARQRHRLKVTLGG